MTVQSALDRIARFYICGNYINVAFVAMWHLCLCGKWIYVTIVSIWQVCQCGSFVQRVITSTVHRPALYKLYMYQS